MRGPIDGIQVHRRVPGRDLGTEPHVFGNGLIAELVHEVGPPVPLEPWRIEDVEHALHRRVRHRSHVFEGRWPERTYRLEDLLGLFRRTRVAPDDTAHGLAVQMVGEGRSGHHEKREEAAQFLRRLQDELTVPTQHLGCLVELPQRRPGVVGVHGMRPEHERRNDAEVAATAADRPVEILVLLGAGGDRAPVGQHHVGGQQVVDGEAVLPGQVADAAAQRQAGDPCGGDGAGGNRQAVGVRRRVHIVPGAAAAHPDRPGAGVDGDVVHPREVDDEAILAQTQASPVVAAAADRREHPLLAAESHSCLDVLHVRAVRDQARPLVDHAVVDLAGLVVARVVRLDQLASQALPERCYTVVSGHRILPDLSVIVGSWDSGASGGRDPRRPLHAEGILESKSSVSLGRFPPVDGVRW